MHFKLLPRAGAQVKRTRVRGQIPLAAKTVMVRMGTSIADSTANVDSETEEENGFQNEEKQHAATQGTDMRQE